jgi:hypothetical protein
MDIINDGNATKAANSYKHQKLPSFVLINNRYWNVASIVNIKEILTNDMNRQRCINVTVHEEMISILGINNNSTRFKVCDHNISKSLDTLMTMIKELDS